MWRRFGKFGWQVTLSLLLGFASDARETAALPAPRDARSFHYTAWTSENGVGAVFDIKQSSDGYLWLTTSRGVLRFDGVRFQSIEEATHGAAHNNEIDSVFFSPSGGLWLTTEAAGLLLWRGEKITAFPDRRCTPTRKRGKLIEDHDGVLWVQGAAGLFRLRGTACEQIGAEQGYPGGFPAGLLLDRNGTLWVKTRTGPLLFLPRGQSKFQVSGYGEGVSTSYAFLHEDPDGAIWLSDDQGLRKVAGKPGGPGFPLAAKGNKANIQYGDFTFEPDGSLWAVTGKGVKRFHHATEWRTPTAEDSAAGETFSPGRQLSSNAVWQVFIDREGTTWVGNNSGLDRLRHTPLTTQSLPAAQEYEFAIAAGDGGTVWTGNSSLPLTRVGVDGMVTAFPATRQILCVRRDHNGTIWASGAGDFHLWRSSGAGFAPVHYPGEDLDAVVSVAVDRNDDPWITTRTGKVYRRSNGAWSNQNEALGKKPGVIGAMADDEAGNVWFGFSNKVAQWDGSDYHIFSFPEGTRNISETTMYVRGNHVWLGGPGGVQLFQQGRFYLMHWNNQDLRGRVSGILETETGDLWTNGFSGITHVTAAELKKWLWNPDYAVQGEHFDELDGLPGLSAEKLPEPSVIEGTDGRLWFATTRGIAWLDPVNLENNRNRVPPPVVISAVISDAKAVSATSNRFLIPARSENLEIDYTALSLFMPDRVTFRYKLDGVDDDWQDVGTRRQAYYTKLRPGQYRFRVIARNNDGIWNTAGAALDFQVAPAWFQTTSFFIFCAAFGIGLLSMLYQLRIRQLKTAIHVRYDERLAERTRIAQELHDTLLQGFLSASMQVHVANDRLPADSPVRPALTRALELMSQVIEEGRNAVRGLRSSQSGSLDLERAFAIVRQDLGPENRNEAPVGFHVFVEGKQRRLHSLLRDEVYRIGREALINAFRHSRAKQIEVTITYTPNQLRVLVRDDGCGINPEILQAGRPGHWGLCGMRERAERIGARLQIFSSAVAGTAVELSIPGRFAFQDQPKSWVRWLRRIVHPRIFRNRQLEMRKVYDRANRYSYPQRR